MNLPTSIIRSSARLAGAAGLAAALLMGCGGTAPRPDREVMRDADPEASQKQIGEKGSGGMSFRYSNQSTDAKMDIDLGSTEVYLEMSGRPANAEDGLAMPNEPRDKRGGSKPESPMQSNQGKQQPEDQKQESQSNQRPKTDPQELPPDNGQGGEDVTGKVLAGIRRAQELFYQKRYPEAMQMVRQSLDAQPTPEGHALAGSICYMMNKNGLARRHWEEALRLNPDMPAVANMLERTRMPGGRGSPSPRPISAPRPASSPPASVMKAAGPEAAPFPEETGSEAAPEPAARPSAKHVAPAAPSAPANNTGKPKVSVPAPAPVPTAEEEDEAQAPAEVQSIPTETPTAEAPVPAEKPAPAPASKAPAVKPVFPTKAKAAIADSTAKAAAAKKAKGK